MKKRERPVLTNESVEQMFRWIRQSISLMYAHHKHPVPMTALIFAYMETFGKALGRTSVKDKVKKFIQTYMHGLCDALNQKRLGFNSDVYLDNKNYKIEEILGNFYRNGLTHQFWMKKGSALFENATPSARKEYLWIEFFNNQKRFMGINIDFLVRDFLNGINEYQNKIINDNNEKSNLSMAILEE